MDPTDSDVPDADLDQMREFKVHVPLQMHLRLHRHRLLTGTSLSKTMSLALARYFDRHFKQEE